MARLSSRSLHFSVLASLLVLSISQLGLNTFTTSFISEYSNQLIPLNLNGSKNDTLVEALPSYIHSDSLRNAALITSMIICVMALVFAALAWPVKIIVRLTTTFHQRVCQLNHSSRRTTEYRHVDSIR